MNTFSATARVVADAILRNAGTTTIASVRLASDTGHGDRKATLWITGSVLGARAEKLAPLLTKGRQVAVSGEVSMREWTKKDGTVTQSLELTIDRLDLIGARAEVAGPKAEPTRAVQHDLIDEIPF